MTSKDVEELVAKFKHELDILNKNDVYLTKTEIYRRGIKAGYEVAKREEYIGLRGVNKHKRTHRKHRRNDEVIEDHNRKIENLLKHEEREMMPTEIIDRIRDKHGIEILDKSATGFIYRAIERGASVEKVGRGRYKYKERV